MKSILDSDRETPRSKYFKGCQYNFIKFITSTQAAGSSLPPLRPVKVFLGIPALIHL